MYFYKAFGLYIESEIEIPQFVSAESAKKDICIEFGDVKKLLPEDKRFQHLSRNSEGEIFFYWDQIGWYLVRNGEQIIVEPIAEAEDKLVQLPLIGVVMAVLLQQRGNLVLHASAVSIENEAVVFVGWKGQGKSTTAAMLYERGHPMLSDDIVLLGTDKNGKCAVVAGFPSFKLMPETVEAVLGDNPENLSEIYTGAGKKFLPAGNFTDETVPLKAVYSLEEGLELQLHCLNPQEAVSVMIANTYSARYPEHLLQGKDAIANLKQCAAVVNEISVCRLERPKSFEKLNELAEFIESRKWRSVAA